MKNLLYYSLIILLVLNAGCKEEEIIAPTESYLRILDNRNYTAQYDPIGVKETPTGGALILTATEDPNTPFSGSAVILTDSLGEIKKSTEAPDNLVAPVGELVQIADKYYYASMDFRSLQVHLIPVNAEGETETPVPVGNALQYPLALSKTSSNDLLLLSYDPTGRESVISIVGIDGVVKRSRGYSIGPATDVEPLIFSHFTNPDAELTFFVGENSDGLYYFNGFYNFTLSMVFTNFGEEPTGVVQGQQTFTGIRSVLPLGGGRFTVMGYQYDRNFLRAQTSLSTNTVTSSVDLFVSELPEVLPNAHSKSILLVEENADPVVITATETQNRQTILYFHDESGILLGIKRLGSLNPFTLSDLTNTSDGGIMLSGTTFLASRFERIYIAKISPIEMDEIIGR
ncbi:MAG: hypothetical protein WBA74_06845 [Cyclobacteriaceae bacterium]